MLSTSEELAERIYTLFRNGRMGRKSFIRNWQSLFEQDDNIGSLYLIWLLLQGQPTPDIEYILKFTLPKIKRYPNRRAW